MIKIRKKKRQTKSLSVKYFESLENRGPLHPSSPHEAWTRKIRRDMEEAGIWITGFMDAGPKFIAEYVSRLQREFNESGSKQHNAFRYIYRKVRTWGLRYKKYEMDPWKYQLTTVYSWVASYGYVYKKGEEYNIRAYAPPVPFNDHGAGI